MDELERRQALAAFLRTRRTRLQPADVGLPARSRRRTPGLRREEVAELANIGVSWYTLLEQGHDVHPSRHVLQSLAQALRLTTAEEQHLFLLASQELPAKMIVEEAQVTPALQRVLDAHSSSSFSHWAALGCAHLESRSRSVISLSRAIPPSLAQRRLALFST